MTGPDLAVVRRWAPAAVLLIAALALGVLTLVRNHDQPSDQHPVVATLAGEQVVGFFSLDYRDPEKGIDDMLASSTKDFQTEYGARRAEIIKGIEDSRAIVTAAVVEDGVAVEYLVDTRAQVLVAVDVTTTIDPASGAGDRSGPGREERMRVRVKLERSGQDWLLHDIQVVG